MVVKIFEENMASNNLRDGKSIIISAHGDDEVLWFESILDKAFVIITAAHPMARSRAICMTDVYSNGNNPYNKAINWIPFCPYVTDQQWCNSRVDSAKCQTDATYGYDYHYSRLTNHVANFVRQGATRIVTHNPWGEYGHPNHRTVSAAARAVGTAMGLDVWNDCVIRPRPDQPGQPYYDANYLPVPTADKVSYANSSSDLISIRNRFKYYHTSCQGYNEDLWTWHDDFPTGSRMFFRISKNGVDQLGVNANLLNMIGKIRGDIPWNSNESMYFDHVAPVNYTC